MEQLRVIGPDGIRTVVIDARAELAGEFLPLLGRFGWSFLLGVTAQMVREERHTPS